MKTILIACSTMVAATMLVFAAEQATSTAEHKVIAPADIKWGDAPPGLPRGAKMAVLNGDPGKAGPFTARLNAPAGYTVSPHTHPTVERLTVISGQFKVGMGNKIDESAMKEVGPGGYVVLPANMAHYAKAAADAIVQIDSEGPFQINYVNPADDPRNAKK